VPVGSAVAAVEADSEDMARTFQKWA
jgi:hypothetical protein